MQLVAYGAQDIYLTGNPQITFFKVVYRRHTNFSMETIEQTINGTSTLTSSATTGTVTISRNGDLVHRVYVSTSTAITNGSQLINEVEIEIGGQRIDRHYQEWNDVWNELTTPKSKSDAFKCMTCAAGTSGSAASTGPGLTQVPLNFWFCRNPGLALPLIALQYHEVKLKFTWGTSTLTGGAAVCKVWCDYIYLDTDERRRFAQVSHEYLIEQVQKQTATASTTSTLNFNHPVKELIWVTPATNAYTTARLVLNGHDRFSDQEEEYFQLRQPMDYHTAVPAQNLTTAFATWNGREMISEVAAAGAGLLCDISEGLDGQTGTDLAATEWNDVLIASSGVTSGTGTVAAGSTTPTCFIVINGTATGSLVDGTLKIGDVHHLSFRAANAAQTSHSAIAVVAEILVRTGDSANVGAGIGPIAGGQTVTESGTSIPAGNIIIEYDRTVTSVITSADNDQLYIRRLGEAGVAKTSKMSKRINVYSFALKPEEHQPSGTCNFSRIDNAQLVTGVTLATTDNIYAVNYNVLRIMSGMGGLAYSN